MKKSAILLTTAEFAKLHGVNKRTLHYYDTIGLFSPRKKGENGYRYYDISQSIDFEYIRMLKALNMSLEEIGAYLEKPNTEKFIEIADTKEQEIEAQIQNMKRTKEILRTKKLQARFCKTLEEQEIKIVECREEKLRILPYDFVENDVTNVYSYVKDKWGSEQFRMGIGSYISADKILNGDFEKYDGIYTPAFRSSKITSITRPRGRYLCGYQKGTWDKLPSMYQRISAFAEKNGLKMVGYAYEMGLNEFVIASQEDYITQIMIKVEEY